MSPPPDSARSSFAAISLISSCIVPRNLAICGNRVAIAVCGLQPKGAGVVIRSSAARLTTRQLDHGPRPRPLALGGADGVGSVFEPGVPREPYGALGEPFAQRCYWQRHFPVIAIRQQRDAHASRALRPDDLQPPDKSPAGALAIVVGATRQFGHPSPLTGQTRAAVQMSNIRNRKGFRLRGESDFETGSCGFQDARDKTVVTRSETR